MLQVVVTKRAQKSLQGIVDYYLSTFTQQRAVKVVQSIEEAFERIALSPYVFPVCFDVKKPVKDVRQMIVHGTFKIVYRIQPDKIEILEIFHGKRNPGLLKGVKGKPTV